MTLQKTMVQSLFVSGVSPSWSLTLRLLFPTDENPQSI